MQMQHAQITLVVETAAVMLASLAMAQTVEMSMSVLKRMSTAMPMQTALIFTDHTTATVYQDIVVMVHTVLT